MRSKRNCQNDSNRRREQGKGESFCPDLGVMISLVGDGFLLGGFAEAKR